MTQTLSHAFTYWNDREHNTKLIVEAQNLSEEFNHLFESFNSAVEEERFEDWEKYEKSFSEFKMMLDESKAVAKYALQKQYTQILHPNFELEEKYNQKYNDKIDSVKEQLNDELQRRNQKLPEEELEVEAQLKELEHTASLQLTDDYQDKYSALKTQVTETITQWVSKNYAHMIDGLQKIEDVKIDAPSESIESINYSKLDQLLAALYRDITNISQVKAITQCPSWSYVQNIIIRNPGECPELNSMLMNNLDEHVESFYLSGGNASKPLALDYYFDGVKQA